MHAFALELLCKVYRTLDKPSAAPTVREDQSVDELLDTIRKSLQILLGPVGKTLVNALQGSADGWVEKQLNLILAKLDIVAKKAKPVAMVIDLTEEEAPLNQKLWRLLNLCTRLLQLLKHPALRSIAATMEQYALEAKELLLHLWKNSEPDQEPTADLDFEAADGGIEEILKSFGVDAAQIAEVLPDAEEIDDDEFYDRTVGPLKQKILSQLPPHTKDKEEDWAAHEIVQRLFKIGTLQQRIRQGEHTPSTLLDYLLVLQELHLCCQMLPPNQARYTMREHAQAVLLKVYTHIGQNVPAGVLRLPPPSVLTADQLLERIGVSLAYLLPPVVGGPQSIADFPLFSALGPDEHSQTFCKDVYAQLLFIHTRLHCEPTVSTTKLLQDCRAALRPLAKQKPDFSFASAELAAKMLYDMVHRPLLKSKQKARIYPAAGSSVQDMPWVNIIVNIMQDLHAVMTVHPLKQPDLAQVEETLKNAELHVDADAFFACCQRITETCEAFLNGTAHRRISKIPEEEKITSLRQEHNEKMKWLIPFWKSEVNDLLAHCKYVCSRCEDKDVQSMLEKARRLHGDAGDEDTLSQEFVREHYTVSNSLQEISEIVDHLLAGELKSRWWEEYLRSILEITERFNKQNAFESTFSNLLRLCKQHKGNEPLLLSARILWAMVRSNTVTYAGYILPEHEPLSTSQATTIQDIESEVHRETNIVQDWEDHELGKDPHYDLANTWKDFTEIVTPPVKFSGLGFIRRLKKLVILALSLAGTEGGDAFFAMCTKTDKLTPQPLVDPKLLELETLADVYQANLRVQLALYQLRSAIQSEGILSDKQAADYEDIRKECDTIYQRRLLRSRQAMDAEDREQAMDAEDREQAMDAEDTSDVDETR